MTLPPSRGWPSHLTVRAVIPTQEPTRAMTTAGTLVRACDHVVIVDNSPRSERPPGSDVEVISAGRNLGYGAAVMLAARGASEDLLLVLNDDVEPSPNFVAALLAPFEDPAVHHVAACLRRPDGLTLDSLGLAVDRTLRSHDVRDVDHVNRVIGPSGAAAAYRRTTFMDLGGFAPELFAYWEDVDLALRFWAAGHRCPVAIDAEAIHRRGSSLGFRSAAQRKLDAYGRGFILERYRHSLDLGARACVPVVDWPSLVRGCAKTRDLAPFAARRAGRRAGAAARLAPLPGSPATRSVRGTVREQLPWPQ